HGRAPRRRADRTGLPTRPARPEPLPPRIFAVADTLDAISSDRPYRRARPWAEAVQVVRDESGAQFDPRVVAALDRADLDFLPRPSGRKPPRGSGAWLRYGGCKAN